MQVSTPTASTPARLPSPMADPRGIADVALAAALRSRADAVYLEPMALDSDMYALTLERHHEVLATVPIHAFVATAVIARLAFIADLDLTAGHPSSGVVPVRSGDRQADVVITVRPGPDLRAELMVARSHATVGFALLSITEIAKGDMIDQYRVLDHIGAGGMGTVYSVEHATIGRKFALKVLTVSGSGADQTASRRFLSEARAAARVQHPNIVNVVDFGSLPDGRPYLVMELLEGESLAKWMDRGALQPTEALAVARKLATGLAAAHARGVIHADVTPSNVLVIDADETEVKLVDFGLSRVQGEPIEREVNVVLGTPAYVSPEQLRGFDADERSDQYGFGAVLFEMLAGHPPFMNHDLHVLCMMHLQAPIPKVQSPHGPLPPRLVELVTTCLQKTPEARFPGMLAVLAALDEVETVANRSGWRRFLSR